jgi:CCR4-NOT transcriptional regulation complex NOT5 subunit
MQQYTEYKPTTERPSSNNILGYKNEKDKQYSLQTFVNKVNKNEANTFGNYYVDLTEMFSDPSEYQGYMKKCVSLTNDDLIDKKQYGHNIPNFILKPTYFEKFNNDTLFYIFYYMPRDTLQLYAAEELYKRKWRYNTDYSIWFTNEGEVEKNEKAKTENFLYFNPNEWKVMKYVYGPLNPKSFLSENEVFKINKSG